MLSSVLRPLLTLLLHPAVTGTEFRKAAKEGLMQWPSEHQSSNRKHVDMWRCHFHPGQKCSSKLDNGVPHGRCCCCFFESSSFPCCQQRQASHRPAASPMADQNHTGPPPWTCCFASATMTTCGSTPRRSGRPSASGREVAVATFSYATCSASPSTRTAGSPAWPPPTLSTIARRCIGR